MRQRPNDDGLLGPSAVAWRVIGHPGALIGGLRSLVLQSLHPLAMAGVAQHSDYERRPLARLQRTTYYVAATAFGDTDTAQAAAARVRRRHSAIRGVDPVTSRPYSADDPDTQLWVHCTEWHSFLAAYREFGAALSPEEEDAYMAEGAIVGSLLGTPPGRIPSSVGEMRDYFAAMRPHLCVSAASRAAIGFVASPPASRETLPYLLPLRLFGGAAVALVPRDLRRLAGIDRTAALDAAALAAVRPLLAAGTLPLVRDLSGLLVGRETYALLAARRDGRSGGHNGRRIG